MKKTFIIISGALVACAIANCEPISQGAQSKILKKLGETPISFEPNRGQVPGGTDPGNVQFISRGLRHDLSFTASGAKLNIAANDRGDVTLIDLRFVNANAAPRLAGVDELGFRSHYFIGSDPQKWIKDIPNFSAVRYNQVWKGVDVVFYGNESRMEYDMVVAPGTDPKNAVVAFGTAQGLQINSQGDLVLHFAQGDVLQHKPVVYQDIENQRKEIPARYAIAGNRVSFEIGEYDKSRELIIDPKLSFSIPRLDNTNTYLTGTGMAVDGSGNIYASGTTIPVRVDANASNFQKTAWVHKLDRAGNIITRYTLVAVDGPMVSNAIAVDASGNMYVTGTTTSPGQLPGSALGFQKTLGGGTDAYLVRVNSNIALAYGTYIGGSSPDSGNAVAVDNSGHAYVAGSTTSSNFPNTIGRLYMGGTDAFLTRIDTNQSGAASLSYSVLVGGSGSDSAQGVAIDSSGNAYLAGVTASTDFQPTSLTGYNTSKATANPDGFLVKLNSAGSTASYVTFYPFGPVNGIALDGSFNAYVTGQTNGAISTNSVTQGYQLSGGAGHAFVAKFNTNTSGVSSLLYATYLAGAGADNGLSITTDGGRTAYVVGSTASANFPLANPVQPTYGGGASNAFLSVLDTGVRGIPSLTFSTFLGGSGTDSGNAVAVNLYKNPSLVGTTSSANFPATPGNPDGLTDPRPFAAKYLFEAVPIGHVDTPVNGATNQSGAIGFTGWAVSTITVANVALCREPVTGENPNVTDPHCLLAAPSPGGLVYLGNATLVPGARPDVAAAFPGYPNNNWGWGAQVLTNFLPDSNGDGGRGNGTYKLHAIAADPEGLSIDIGTTTMSANNAGSVFPFGTIDTPGEGATVSGAVQNFGWALTPQPNIIPIDGSTITVIISGLCSGVPLTCGPTANHRPSDRVQRPPCRYSVFFSWLPEYRRSGWAF